MDEKEDVRASDMLLSLVFIRIANLIQRFLDRSLCRRGTRDRGVERREGNDKSSVYNACLFSLVASIAPIFSFYQTLPF